MKDKLGIFFSGLCVLHCLIYTVLIVGGVSSAGFLRVSEEVLHPLLLIFVVIIGLISFPSSYKLHDNLRPMGLGIIGTIGLFFALFFNTTLEVVLTIFFGSLLIFAHYWNNKLIIS